MSIEREDFYQRLRKKLRDWAETEAGKNYKYAEYLLLVPDFFHLLCKLALDKDIPVKEKAKLAGAIVYFVSPVDVIPEALVGPVGYIDDLALSAYVLNGIINKTDPEIVLKHWAGEGDILALIKRVLEKADEMVGSGLWKKLKGLVAD